MNLSKLFGFDPRTMNVKTEILAGITTFLTMAYILAVNPNILGSVGMDKGAVFTTTAIVSVLATLVMALYAKMPFALAPGMGLNAFFAYTVCTIMGYSWQFALAAVFIEGLIFILLTVTNLRDIIVNAIPASLRNAIGPGIGLYIAFIGLKNGGVIVHSDATFVTLGTITHGSGLLSVIGIVLTGVLLILNVRGALLLGILGTALIGIPMGLTTYGGLTSIPPSIAPIAFQFDFSQLFTIDMLIVIFTFLFIDMFDTIGTLVGVSTKAGMIKDGKVPRLRKAFMADALGTTFGALLGSSTVTTYVESASGVAQGGRSGLTAFTTAVCFAVALLFAPIFLAIPGAATCPVLVIVGLFMLSPIKDIDFDDYSESIPAFICLIIMPLTYSISDGILIGIISYVLLNLLSRKYRKLTPAMYVLAVLFVLKYIFI
ncbi:MAG: NCS2 family permease [Tannerella sp.]|uniref:NCS2 family permease n=1 Tax=Tannerella sp. TaxID=2382127 RepID=UPI003FA2EF84